MTHWVVVHSNGQLKPANIYGAFDSSADKLAHKPFDRATAEAVASNINEFTQTKGVAWAMPVTETVQPGV